MATHEEPLPKWLEEEIEKQGVLFSEPQKQGVLPKWRERELLLQKTDKRDPSEVSKPAYERGTPCPY